MPALRASTTRLLAICSHQPTRLRNKKSSTTSTPFGDSGALIEYFVFAPSHASSALILSYVVDAFAVTSLASLATRSDKTNGVCAYCCLIAGGMTSLSADRSMSAVAGMLWLVTV